ncbi:flagellar hook-basal body complex protein FliE [Falsiroseomonas sp.]|uniref:flagellar hook-basal body complex protein FliE n=1 Tax=Falsiroseomonas sp. TaxID=2870721 RepID=UPI0027221E40|nr:flagellar hook-basal body complex protein FliE [Falsiroseomonas sp.]MDO9499744.1 flagellar hook-basal body complex protein FliE [Falsiroseomonas sp.]MDP3414833.1 flagellar hook-basal body complex protein FliE [Falsiroseomonas sp.]
MAIGAAQAAAAYASAGTGRPLAIDTEAAGGGAGFGAALNRAMEAGVQLGRNADAASTQALMGQGSVSDAVLSISRAELALQTAVTLRDRVVAAYQEVMRMPI